jgi:ferredoxin
MKPPDHSREPESAPATFREVGLAVIGSGPAAIAATMALVGKGHHVTILDVGDRLDDARIAALADLASKPRSEWDPRTLATISPPRESAGHPKKDLGHAKLSYGSDYSFARSDDSRGPVWEKGKPFHHSHALGGLSNVWGSSVLPMRAEDMKEWPFPLTDLVPHYEAVTRFMPVTRSGKGIREWLPSYATHEHPIPLSSQASALERDLDRHRDTLHLRGFRFGASRLAIKASGGGENLPCNLCGRCLTGCPYSLIYSSAHTLRDLIAAKKVTYLPGHAVRKLKTAKDLVHITGVALEHEQPFEILATRVFLGAGIIPTADIVFESIPAVGRSTTFLDSQYFIYPLLRFKAVKDAEAEDKHTSAQLFIEIDDPAISPHLVHMQIYGHSGFLVDELESTFLRHPLRWKWFRRQFIGRLLIAQGFIHSTHSGKVELRSEEQPDGTARLHARCKPSREAFLNTLKVGWKLMRHAFETRMIPLFPGLKFPDPGASYHTGSSFPMSREPSPRQTNRLGSFPDHPNIHLVDASVMPCIPATTITFTIMANAHRIASEAVITAHP